MFILVQVLFAISLMSFSLCVYLLINEIRSVFFFKNRRKLLFISSFTSLISGVLSCIVQGNYTFFILETCSLISDGMTWFIFFIFTVFGITVILIKIFNKNNLPNHDGVKGELVKIRKDDITIQVEVGPQILMLVDENINKQIGVWTHDGKTDYIIFSCTVDKSDMLAYIYKKERCGEVYFCDNALMLGKDSVIKKLIKIGRCIARSMFVFGMLLANYEMFYLPDHSYLPDYTPGYSLVMGSFTFLLFSWFIMKYGKGKGVLERIFCGISWLVVIEMAVLFAMAIIDSTTWTNLFVVYDYTGNVLHSLF